MDNNVQPMEDVKEPVADPIRAPKSRRPRDDTDDKDDDEDSGQKPAKLQKRSGSASWILECENKAAFTALRGACGLLSDIAVIIVEYTPVKELEVVSDCGDDHKEVVHMSSPCDAYMDSETGWCNTSNWLAAALAFSDFAMMRNRTIYSTTRSTYSIRRLPSTGKWTIVQCVTSNSSVIRSYYHICPSCTAYAFTGMAVTEDPVEVSIPGFHLCLCENSADSVPVFACARVQDTFFRLPSAAEIRALIQPQLAQLGQHAVGAYEVMCEWDDGIVPMTE
jgi:hypothetical protein